MSNSPLQQAQIGWNEAGTPVSNKFDDVYFSNDNGLNETRYVFLQQNHLPERFTKHDRPNFVIAETGFGTGLNFLATLTCFLQHAPRHGHGSRLHFISFEKYPLSRADLTKALAPWRELAPWCDALITQWPIAIAGCHRLHFAQGRVQLDLWFGDVNDTLPQLPHGADGLVDAWFLDGFSPAKNPQMWSPTLFTGLARLARPNATLATFTCAGFVRRGLIDAGFAMQKVKGYGIKREMLRGVRYNKQPCASISSFYPRHAGREGVITLIGGGIASAMLALSLVERGRNVILLCQDSAPAQGASGNRQGALYPLLNGEHSPLSQFYAQAFVYARQRLLTLAEQHDIAYHLCGVTQLGYSPTVAQKLQQISEGPFPADLLKTLNPETLSEHIGLPCEHGGLHYPLGGWLCPADLSAAALAQATKSGLLAIHYQSHVTQISACEDGWQLTMASGQNLFSPNVVIAAGANVPALLPFAHLPLYPVRGQVSHVANNATLAKLRNVLCYEGYLTPNHNGNHCLGASYGRNQTDLTFNEDEQQQNKEKLLRACPQQSWPHEINVNDNQARVGVRCATRDHFPMVGGLCDYQTLNDTLAHSTPAQGDIALPTLHGLYLFAALGSRGLCSAPLCAELLASEICDEPLPMPIAVLNAIHPSRYWVRKWLKTK